MVYTSCRYRDGDLQSKEEAVRYLKLWETAMTPHCSGGSYINFIDPLVASTDGEEGDNRMSRYYGENAQRLSRVKQTWNEGGTLHFPMGIV